MFVMAQGRSSGSTQRRSPEAKAAWRWYNYVSSQTPCGKIVLRLNLDETSICLYQGDLKGNIFISSKSKPSQHVPHARRRCNLTHIGVICDNSEIQPRLPQVVIGGEAALRAGDMPALRAACPANFFLLRQRTAWSSSLICAWLVRAIAAALAPYTGRFQPVLILDASKTHITSWVFEQSCRSGIWLVLVPARLTWLLQPLDTHAFQRLKARLRRAYQDARIRSGTSDLAIHDFLPCLYTAVRGVFQGTNWADAFDSDGFGVRQERVSARVVSKLSGPPAGQVLATRPTDAEVAVCFPRRAAVPTAIWRPYDAPVRAPLVPLRAPAPRPALAGASAPSVPRAFGRTRSETRRLGEAAAVAAAAAAPAAPAAAAPPCVPAVFGRTRSETRRLRGE